MPIMSTLWELADRALVQFPVSFLFKDTQIPFIGLKIDAPIPVLIKKIPFHSRDMNAAENLPLYRSREVAISSTSSEELDIPDSVKQFFNSLSSLSCLEYWKNSYRHVSSQLYCHLNDASNKAGRTEELARLVQAKAKTQGVDLTVKDLGTAINRTVKNDLPNRDFQEKRCKLYAQLGAEWVWRAGLAAVGTYCLFHLPEKVELLPLVGLAGFTALEFSQKQYTMGFFWKRWNCCSTRAHCFCIY
jgi:hypothetical protein